VGEAAGGGPEGGVFARLVGVVDWHGVWRRMRREGCVGLDS
jgi:hypothetical protein